jgi:hypothetical protein
MLPSVRYSKKQRRRLPDADTDQSRTVIRQLLELIGDPEAQRSYELDVPIADVPAELVCMWFDEHDHPDSAWFFEAFTDDERAVLAAFDQFHQLRLDALPTTSRIEELQRSKEWGEIMDQANATLIQLGGSTKGETNRPDHSPPGALSSARLREITGISERPYSSMWPP